AEKTRSVDYIELMPPALSVIGANGSLTASHPGISFHRISCFRRSDTVAPGKTGERRHVHKWLILSSSRWDSTAISSLEAATRQLGTRTYKQAWKLLRNLYQKYKTSG